MRDRFFLTIKLPAYDLYFQYSINLGVQVRDRQQAIIQLNVDRREKKKTLKLA